MLNFALTLLAFEKLGLYLIETIHSNINFRLLQFVAIDCYRARRQLSSSQLRHRELSGYLGSEELHHQQGDPQGEEKCKIM